MLSPSLTSIHHQNARRVREDEDEPKTNALIWCAAVICTIITVAVIICGITVFVGYLVIRPRVPFVSVRSAHLDLFDFDQVGVLTTQLTIVLRAENDNRKAHSSFSDFRYTLSFDSMEIAELQAHPFDLGRNDTADLNYVVQSRPITLDKRLMRAADLSLKQNMIRFHLRGHSKARWRVGPLGSVKYWCNLDCLLAFKGVRVYSSSSSHCTSKFK